MGTFRTLIAWQKAMDLVDEIYRAVRLFPRDELFGLTAQMKAAAVSTPSLLAEGKGRYADRDQRHFYIQARGSNYELQTQIEIAVRQQFLNAQNAKSLIDLSEQVGRLINGLLRSLEPKGEGPRAKG
jgi:four helix bundle protein